MAQYSGNNQQLVVYGLTQALTNQPPRPIISKRAPLTTDQAQLGTVWVVGIDSSGVTENTAWILTSIINNSANWQAIGGGSGAGVFSSLTVNPGPTSLTGNFSSTGGTFTVATGTNAINISADAAATTVNLATGAAVKTVTIGNSTSTTTLNLVAGTGNVNVTNGDFIGSGKVEGVSLYATGDGAGVASTNAVTNVTNTTQGAGTLSIKSTTGNNGNNTGFIKCYVGVTAVYLPYFATINP